MPVPIRPDVAAPKAPEPDKDLIAHLEEMLAAAKDGSLQSYLCSYTTEDAKAYWFSCPDEEYRGPLALEARRALARLEAEDE